MAISQFSYANNYTTIVDSLLLEINDKTVDTTKIEIYSNILEIYLNQNDVELGLPFYQKIKKLNDKNNRKGDAQIAAYIGRAYYNKGDYGKAMKYYVEALAVVEKSGDDRYESFIYNYMGSVFKRQRKFDKAIEYYQKGLSSAIKKNDNAAVADSYNRMGIIYHMQSDLETALEFYLKSLKIKEEIGAKSGIAESYGNLGILYENLKQFDNAIEYYLKSTEIRKELGDEYGIAINQNNLGKLYMDMGKFSKGLNYIDSSIKASSSLGMRDLTKDSYLLLSQCYKRMGNYKESLDAYEIYTAYSDSLYDQESQHQVAELEKKYETDKKEKEIELLNKEKKLQQLETEKTQAKSKQQQAIIITILAGLLTVIGFLGVLFQRFKKEKLQKEKIAKQKDEIAGKNTEIIDSITYAKRIQQAILNGEEYESKNLPEHFILFKPKDIVSGDFYWVHEHRETLYMAVADCTGHGVPGALMSMLGISLLNDIVNDNPNISPANLLDQLRNRVIKELSQDEHNSESRDGMDISLIKLNIKTREVEWSGANNPLWILRSGATEIEEIKPDKQPISHYIKMDSFTNHSVSLLKGDLLYLFSDGYADQFGGLKGKKLKYPVFKKLMIKNCKEKMDMQKLLLSKYIENWSDDFAQVDDICIFGVRV